MLAKKDSPVMTSKSAEHLKEKKDSKQQAPQEIKKVRTDRIKDKKDSSQAGVSAVKAKKGAKQFKKATTRELRKIEQEGGAVSNDSSIKSRKTGRTKDPSKPKLVSGISGGVSSKVDSKAGLMALSEVAARSQQGAMHGFPKTPGGLQNSRLVDRTAYANGATHPALNSLQSAAHAQTAAMFNRPSDTRELLALAKSTADVDRSAALQNAIAQYKMEQQEQEMMLAAAAAANRMQGPRNLYLNKNTLEDKIVRSRIEQELAMADAQRNRMLLNNYVDYSSRIEQELALAAAQRQQQSAERNHALHNMAMSALKVGMSAEEIVARAGLPREVSLEVAERMIALSSQMEATAIARQRAAANESITLALLREQAALKSQQRIAPSIQEALLYRGQLPSV